VKEKIDDNFLRHNKRISQKLEGYKNDESAKKSKEAAPAEEEPVPLAMIPPSGKNVAPHLPKNILQGIGEGFLQIQSETVSAALLEEDDIDV
jgi:hypothetical protein